MSWGLNRGSDSAIFVAWTDAIAGKPAPTGFVCAARIGHDTNLVGAGFPTMASVHPTLVCLEDCHREQARSHILIGVNAGRAITEDFCRRCRRLGPRSDDLLIFKAG
jgi:hypothetical protein